MSQTNLIYCKPIPELEKYWQFLGSEGQLFYDYRLNLFTFRKGTEFMTISIKDNLPVPDIKYQIKVTESIAALTYSKDKKYVAIQTSMNMLRIINLHDGREHKITLKTWDRNHTIILFDWIWKSYSGVDFFIVDLYNLRLYKLDEEKFQLKELAAHSIDSQYAWFEPKTETIVLGNVSGTLQTIFTDNYAKSKKIKGPSFNLDLRLDLDTPPMGGNSKFSLTGKPKQPFFAELSLRNRNLLHTNVRDQNMEYHRHKIMVVFMYGFPTVVHINSNLGKVFVFHLTVDKVIPYQPSFTIPCESLYSLSLVDNLLIINNISENISFFYDTKKSNPIQTVGSPQSVLVYKTKPLAASSQIQEPPKTTQEELPKDTEGTELSSVDTTTEATTTTTELSNTETLSSTTKEESKAEVAAADFPAFSTENAIYMSTTSLLDYSLMVDVKNQSILAYELHPEAVTRLLDDKVDTLFFLIRRLGCKEQALVYLKEIVESKQDLTMLSFIFNKFSEIYKKAQEERDAMKDMSALQVNAPHANYNINTRSEMLNNFRTQSSYSVVIQSDLHSKIFAPLSDNENFDQEYLIEALLEYFRISVETNIPILDETQAIFFKLVLKNKKFILLQALLQFHCLHDNADLAEVLVKLGMQDKSKFTSTREEGFTKYVEGEYFPEMLQLGLDMLMRLDRFPELIQHLLSFGQILDAMEMAKKRGFAGINPRWFLDAADKEGASCSRGDVMSFFLSNVRKNKSEEKALFEPDLIEIIKNFQSERSPKN